MFAFFERVFLSSLTALAAALLVLAEALLILAEALLILAHRSCFQQWMKACARS
jgi:hypothetical protein